jgi:hypothetical protein
VLFRQRVRLGGLRLRHVESLQDRLEHRVARRAELLGRSPQEDDAIDGRISVEGRADAR